MRSHTNSASDGETQARVRRIELNLREVGQLFNTMDPSPFHEKDLDREVEGFIVSWAREFPIDEPVTLVIHVGSLPQEEGAQAMVEGPVHHYFAHRVELNRLEFRHLMQDGRRSLLTDLTFLAACLAISRFLVGSWSWNVFDFRTGSLVICGFGWACGGRSRFISMTGGHCGGAQRYSRN